MKPELSEPENRSILGKKIVTLSVVLTPWLLPLLAINYNKINPTYENGMMVSYAFIAGLAINCISLFLIRKNRILKRFALLTLGSLCVAMVLAEFGIFFCGIQV